MREYSELYYTIFMNAYYLYCVSPWCGCNSVTFQVEGMRDLSWFQSENFPMCERDIGLHPIKDLAYESVQSCCLVIPLQSHVLSNGQPSGLHTRFAHCETYRLQTNASQGH